ncbi:hypothetical protein BpHYR1_025474 [Brachionus plicatilis]|uniref:Uncharacterized protein n=1 Tax=Brachionus plicatilis TaxID=10195 RepID=A0A3M7Q3B5_BRAPC|nr:hypothetical protein BpHYR1_025474 [Brachionus plicatilis]
MASRKMVRNFSIRDVVDKNNNKMTFKSQINPKVCPHSYLYVYILPINKFAANFLIIFLMSPDKLVILSSNN